jgi:hypothetical protein
MKGSFCLDQSFIINTVHSYIKRETCCAVNFKGTKWTESFKNHDFVFVDATAIVNCSLSFLGRKVMFVYPSDF